MAPESEPDDGPELSEVEDSDKPLDASDTLLDASGGPLGTDEPQPIVASAAAKVIRR